MESTDPIANSPDDQPRANRVFTVTYLEGGRYALDRLSEETGSHRLQEGRSLRAIRAALLRIQQPGDVVIMSEALRALQLLELPCRRLVRMQKDRGAEALFDLHGEVEIIPLPGHPLEGTWGSVHPLHSKEGSPAPNRIKHLFVNDEQSDADEVDPHCN